MKDFPEPLEASVLPDHRDRLDRQVLLDGLDLLGSVGFLELQEVLVHKVSRDLQDHLVLLDDLEVEVSLDHLVPLVCLVSVDGERSAITSHFCCFLFTLRTFDQSDAFSQVSTALLAVLVPQVTAVRRDSRDLRACKGLPDPPEAAVLVCRVPPGFLVRPVRPGLAALSEPTSVSSTTAAVSSCASTRTTVSTVPVSPATVLSTTSTPSTDAQGRQVRGEWWGRFTSASGRLSAKQLQRPGYLTNLRKKTNNTRRSSAIDEGISYQLSILVLKVGRKKREVEEIEQVEDSIYSDNQLVPHEMPVAMHRTKRQGQQFRAALCSLVPRGSVCFPQSVHIAALLH